MAKKRLGRPLLLTPEMANQIGAILQLGLPIQDACDAAGISDQTYLNWFNEGERLSAKTEKAKSRFTAKQKLLLGFFGTCKAARATGKVSLVNELNLIALNRAHPKQAYVLSWLLERMHPVQFGRRTIRLEMGNEDGTGMPPLIDTPGAGVPQATCNIIIEGGAVPPPGEIVEEPDEPEEGEEAERADAATIRERVRSMTGGNGHP